MKILALDTATENCSVALLIDGQLTARERLLERGHAECILPMIDEVLGEAGTPLASLTAIAFGRGPGSFTGVRLAASVTQGLAHGSGVPAVPVSDLAAVAQRILGDDETAQRVLVCNDARMREVYWGCFVRSAGGLAGPVGEERVSEPGQVALPAGWSAGPELRGAGTGFAAHPPLRSSFSTILAAIREVHPRAAEVALLAVSEVTAGRLRSPEDALPVYLRDDVVRPGPAGH
ncbi:MAG TPA: tRNA (adenosine(37)-N6)-threonylcarbamoyltransferase complex dimerization subunit type 1 TsaB [Deltaproteobacteria bacterium]|nr:tRNA (adenosine(37)-N6)-threonylcarbamoyltransferase complex dimerization subunit type 1 TsaB [Deltaproteobacteria bacterium]